MDQEIRFGGSGAVPAAVAPAGSGAAGLPRDNAEFQRRYADRLARRPTWLKVLEAAANQLRASPEGRAEYGDPERGATLPQAWRMQFAISGQFKVCLLARGRPATPTEDIPEVVLIAPADLAAALARGFDEMDTFDAQLFVHDGRTGHSVALVGHDAGTATFTYHDPWPDRSLLCREFNAAGVDAQPAENGLWRITDAELAKVVFAAFVMPTDWAQLTGRPFRIAYATLQQHDFWTFFHLHETGRQPEGARTRVTLQPGGFQQEVDLGLELDGADMVRKALLALRRSWVVGPPFGINPFARDIAKSFVAAFLPEPDQPAGAVHVQALAELHAGDAAKALIARRDQPDLSTAERLQLAYLGLAETATVLLPFCRIDVNNAQLDGEPWLRLAIDLY